MMMNEACAADLGPLIGLILTCIIVAIPAIIATATIHDPWPPPRL